MAFCSNKSNPDKLLLVQDCTLSNCWVIPNEPIYVLNASGVGNEEGRNVLGRLEDGRREGIAEVGFPVGFIEGPLLGILVGDRLGRLDGKRVVGLLEGNEVGMAEGEIVGDFVGVSVGLIDGILEG